VLATRPPGERSHLFHLLRKRRGSVTLAQIRRMSRLLADHADALYRRAGRVERGAVAARVPKALSLAALARQSDAMDDGRPSVGGSCVTMHPVRTASRMPRGM